MNNLESLKNELISQKNILQQKNYVVTTAHTYPSPAEITTTLNQVMDNVPEISSYANFYKTLIDPQTFNTPINNLVLPENIQHIRDYAFYNLGNLLTGNITFPSSLQTIGSRAFYGTNLSSVTFNEGLTEIGGYSFYGTTLQSIIIPNTVTALGSYAFYNVNNITQLQLSNSLPKLETNLFKVLNNITSITIPASIGSIGSNNFVTVPLLDSFYILGNNTTFASSTTFTTHNENLKIIVNFERLNYYVTYTNLSRVHDHIYSQYTITDLSFPTVSKDLAWYSSLSDAQNKTNAITTPTSVGTYYCRLA